MNEFVKLLKKIRTESNVSIYKLAQLSGVPESSIRNWENGGFMPTLDKYAQALDALGYELNIEKKGN